MNTTRRNNDVTRHYTANKSEIQNFNYLPGVIPRPPSQTVSSERGGERRACPSLSVCCSRLKSHHFKQSFPWLLPL